MEDEYLLVDEIVEVREDGYLIKVNGQTRRVNRGAHVVEKTKSGSEYVPSHLHTFS